MFNSKTLFIFGAGASKEAGLPTGNELTATIANMLDIKFDDDLTLISGDRVIYQALQRHVHEADGQGGDIYSYQQAGWLISNAMPQASSIDSFIDAHQGDEKVTLCGKLAIVRSILEAERNSSLFFDDRQRDAKLSFANLQETWYERFFRLLVDGSPKGNVYNLFDNVSFIIFNYDRAVEHFLFNAVQNYYNIEPDEAADLLNRALRLFHPYGFVGHLPWQTDTDSIPFGSAIQGAGLLSHAGIIMTYSERIEDETAITALHRLLIDAETIVFLGFAFHNQNMMLMKSSAPNNLERVFATAIGISSSDLDIVGQQITDVFGKNDDQFRIELRQGLSCYQLFDEYSRTLSQL